MKKYSTYVKFLFNKKFFYICKRALLLCISFSILSNSSFANDFEKLTIGTGSNYPPFYAKDSQGEMVGFDIDLIKTICIEAKFECKIISMPWHKLVPSLLHHEIDIIAAALSITKERKKMFDFSIKYANTPMAVAVHKEVQVKNMSQLKIGARVGTLPAQYLTKYFKDNETEILEPNIRYQSALVNRTLDAVIDDIAVLKNWLITKEGTCCKIHKILPIDKEFQDLGFGFGVSKQRPELTQKIDEAIHILRANGTYQRLNDKYFDFNVYGN